MIPDLDYYEPQHMKSSKTEAFKTWHAEQVLKGDVWNMQNEMLEYCKSDVNLMKEGCMKFASDFQKEGGFNPLTKCVTLHQPVTIASETSSWNRTPLLLNHSLDGAD